MMGVNGHLSGGTRVAMAAMGLSLGIGLSACTPGGGGNDNLPGNDNVIANDNGEPVGNENDNEGTAPVFPENYRESFTEVRNCRFSVEHAGFQIRVLANDVALAGYLSNQNPLPVGSILIKEEFGAPTCDDDTLLDQFRVMRKEEPGFDPTAGDWHFQRVLVDRQVVEDSKDSCIACHSVPECFERDFMCTLP